MFLIVGNRVIFKFYKWHPGTYEKDSLIGDYVLPYESNRRDQGKENDKYQGICPIARKTVFPRNTRGKAKIPDRKVPVFHIALISEIRTLICDGTHGVSSIHHTKASATCSGCIRSVDFSCRRTTENPGRLI